MKAKKSFLKFKDFTITKLYYEYFDIETDDIDIFNEDYLDNAPIDIEFDLEIYDKSIDFFIIPLKIVINSKKLPEYPLYIEISTLGEFYIENNLKTTEEEKIRFLFYSALPMLISSVRNYIMSITYY